MLRPRRSKRNARTTPRLLADYRAGGVTLEQLMDLTITDDPAAQDAAFYAAPEWQCGASALRERLTEREISASHAPVRFCRARRPTEAGGGIRRDLFAEGDAGTYLTDAALLESLVRGKLDARAEADSREQKRDLRVDLARRPANRNVEPRISVKPRLPVLGGIR